jgi:DNA-binding CsgD family transcriptional regulator
LTISAVFQFFIGICLASSFYVFCFILNNAERLFGIVFISICSALFYHIFGSVSITAFSQTGKNLIGMIIFLVLIFFSFRKKDDHAENVAALSVARNVDAEFSVFLVILLALANQLMRMMMNDMAIAGELHRISYGSGTPAAIILILVLHVYVARSTLYSWILSLIFSLVGISLLIFDSLFTLYAGSFVWGLGNVVGYITTFFLCCRAIFQSNSFKMYRIFTMMMFAYHAILRGIIFNVIIPHFEVPPNVMAFTLVLALSCICFVMMPYLQRKIFDNPWSDGPKLSNMIENTPSLAETEQLDALEQLGLSPREKEIFFLLLGDSQRKHIADTLRIGTGTVNFHVNNLYRKLGIQSRIELFAKYGKKLTS